MLAESDFGSMALQILNLSEEILHFVCLYLVEPSDRALLEIYWSVEPRQYYLWVLQFYFEPSPVSGYVLFYLRIISLDRSRASTRAAHRAAMEDAGYVYAA